MYYNGSAMCCGGFREQRHWAMGPNLQRDERWQRGPEFPVHGIFTYSERVLTEGSSQEGGTQTSATSAEDGTQGLSLTC